MLPRPRSRRPLPLAFGFLLAVGTPPATRAASPAMTESGASAPSSSLATVSPAAPAPPVAPVRPHRFAEHGRERVDDYYWLRDDSRRDPEVLAYLAAENSYTQAVLAPTEPLQARLERQLSRA